MPLVLGNVANLATRRVLDIPFKKWNSNGLFHAQTSMVIQLSKLQDEL